MSRKSVKRDLFLSFGKPSLNAGKRVQTPLPKELVGTIGVIHFRKSEMNHECAKEQANQGDNTSFWPRGTTCEPIRPLGEGIQEPTHAQNSTIKSAIEKRLRPVPCCVKS